MGNHREPNLFSDDQPDGEDDAPPEGAGVRVSGRGPLTEREMARGMFTDDQPDGEDDAPPEDD
ncbi:hypothetical protein ACFYST_14795 [Kitasatospora sp. NPDC004614]|uniref:hypothetical protein n=1 Tax=unclassified Kitasatospora TaxID=2633591 RepID=UPI00369183BC